MMVNKDGELEGFSIDLIKKIADMLSFRYDIYLSPDGLYGGGNKNTGYTGIVGEITKNVSTRKQCFTMLVSRNLATLCHWRGVRQKITT